MAFSPDGLLASGSADGTIKLWDISDLVGRIASPALNCYSRTEMSALKDRATQLIDQLPESVIAQFVEDLEDALELEQAIAEEGDQPDIPLEKLVHQLKRAGKLP